KAKVLRAIERREFRRLGGTRKIKVDVRIISAANVDLEEAVRARRFREDLFYRLKVVHIPIPPLRERREAIVLMAEMFLQEFTEKHGRRPKVFAEEALERLRQYAWPGNVRELRNLIESLVLMTKGEKIRERDLPANVRAARARTEIRLPVGLTLKEAEKEILRCYLEVFPTKKEAAWALNIGLRTLHAKVKEYGLASHRQEPSARKGAEMAVHGGEDLH
ncbi:MAG: sigma-54-dependent Fis family transcriptional regulator, partial [Deltaproteobacteria bacterium]|nr:sigma-54-dependent Fis family transcriptional regulator [Deltaproteobacteria bacterium]